MTLHHRHIQEREASMLCKRCSSVSMDLPDTRVMVRPSWKALEKAEAMAPLPDKHSTPNPSSRPTTSVIAQRLWPAKP